MVKINNISNNSPTFKGAGIEIGPALCDALTVISKSSTAVQRGVIGTSAGILQPNIDLKNKNVDEETRTLNASRSLARAIVGTVTGIAIRCGFIALTKKMVKDPPTTAIGKFFSCEALEDARRTLSPEKFTQKAEGYGEVFGTALALFTMLFTNICVDVPLTHKLSMWINKNFYSNNTKTEVQK